jgi:transcriptional regulator with PAS, ATPase and Fis domain
VLILGETGVGKEHLARLLHDSSPHARGPFVALNCAAIPAELLEAELFGIGRGIATGVAERAGRLREAHGGTLFLDEIGDMPLALQAKLLRVLESGTVEPVGAAAVRVQVRFVAATNAALGDRIAAGQFRADLYYRLSGYALSVPPLRERREDIAPLLEHFLAKACRQTGKRIGGVTLKALRLLQRYDWPGNIRQLDNEARRLVVRCPEGQPIDSTLLPAEILNAPVPAQDASRELDLEQAVAALERRLILQALEQAGNSRSGAARLLGLSRNGLAAKMERLKIDVRSRVETGE